MGRAAPSFDNSDFVDVVIQSYRHRFGLAPGFADYEDDERFLAGLPTIESPAIVLDPTEDRALAPRAREQHAERFAHLLDYRRILSGHNQPFDAPTDVALAVRDLQAFLESTTHQHDHLALRGHMLSEEKKAVRRIWY